MTIENGISFHPNQGYPDGFSDWPLEERNKYFAAANKHYWSERKGIDDHRSTDYTIKPIVELIEATNLTPKGVNWIWPGYLARGKLHLLAGQPGSGKTTLALKLAAIVSSGGFWPDGLAAEKGKVIILSAEDDVQDTLLPRLLAAGAERDNILFVGGVKKADQKVSFDLSSHIDILKEAIIRTGGVSLIIVDPIVSAITSDSHKNSETRKALQPLVDLTNEIDAALLGITHLTKGTSGRDPIERITGSIAFSALPRLVFLVAKDEQSTELPEYQRIFIRAKSNIGRDGDGFKFSLNQLPLNGNSEMPVSVVEFKGVIKGSARELLSQVEFSEQDGRKLVEIAKDWLLEALASGPMSSKDVFSMGEAQGMSKSTLIRAQKLAKIKAQKKGMQDGWEWSLPEESQDL